MLDVCDLIYVLKQNNGRLRGCLVTGFIGKELSKPSTLYDNVHISINGRFVEMNCCTIEFKGEDYVRTALGDGNNQKRYIIRGNMIMFIHAYTKLGDFYQVQGTVSFTSKKDTDVVGLFNFKRRENWALEPSTVKDIEVTYWDKSARPYNFLISSVKANGIVIPQDIQNMIPFRSFREESTGVLQKFGENNKSLEADNNNSDSADNNMVSETRTSGREIFSRREILKKNCELVNKLQGVLVDSEEQRKKQKEALSSKFHESDKYVKQLINNINSNWNNGGRRLLKEYISTVDGADSKYLGQTIKDYLVTIKDELFDYLFNDETILTASGKCLGIARKLFSNKEQFYSGVLGKIIGKDLTLAQLDCERNNVCFSEIVNKNPYILIMFCPSLKFKDIEYIALCMNKAGLQENRSQRNICMVYDYLVRSNGNDTLYEINELRNKKFALKITANERNLMWSRGTYLSKEKILNISKFLNIDVTKNKEGYLSENWVTYGNYCYSYLTDTEFTSACRNLVICGLGSMFEHKGVRYITSFALLEKELFVYNKIYELAEEEVDIKTLESNINCSIDEFIQKELDDFEEQKGFELEEQQRKCGELIKYPVSAIYGLAGGGKTTMSQCIANMLYDLYGDDYVIKYAAPTGIASKRLEEALDEKVYTMHSMFKIGHDIVIEEDSESNFLDVADCYIFDEMSMVALDLIYKVLKKVDKPRLILLGDISQLAPIQKGVPFRDFLNMIPCETLTVSKRSLEGSKISRNNDILINEPTTALEEGSDFSIVNTHTDNISSVIRSIVEYYIGKKPKGELKSLGITDETLLKKKFKPNEIQVLSPVAQLRYSWGTTSLNKMLQSVMNEQPSKNCFYVGKEDGLQLRINDRVLHTENNYRMLHYEYDGKYTFTRTCDYGVVNGDVGYIRAILKASQCIIEDADDMETYKDIEKLVRDDSDYIEDKDAYFLVVDYDGFYALYPIFENFDYQNNYQKVYRGNELNSLALAYALTVHKTQGSQRQLIIFALGRANFTDFINLNLIYTGVSRASVAEFLVGDVSSDSNSTLSKGRNRQQQKNVKTVMNLLYS